MREPAAGRRRVLIISQVYEPEPNFITADVARALAEHCDVTVVTAHPNYPLGRFYPGVRYLRISKSVADGVTVWRVPFIPDHSLSAVRRGISYLSFAAIASVVAPFVAGRPDTVWVYHGPFTTGLAALFFKYIYRSRLIFTCADLWPDSFLAAGVVKSRTLIRIAEAYNSTLNKAADLVICATQGTRRRFVDGGIPAERLPYVPVWIAGTSELARKTPPNEVGCHRIVYAGNLGPAQNLETVVRAAGSIMNLHPSVTFDLYGSGTSEEELKSLARQLGATNVVFHGRVPPEVAFQASSSALAQIVSLQSSPLFAKTVPSKLFSAFAAASPILYGLTGEAARLAEDSGGGIRFEGDDPDSLVSAIEALIALPREERNAMRSRLRRYFSDNFDPRVLIARYVDLLTCTQEPTSRSAGIMELGAH